jgi:penicillin amidase
LAWSDFELARAELEERIGRAAVDALFPADAWLQEPIQPTTRSAPRPVDGRVPAPVPDAAARRSASLARALAPQVAALRTDFDGVIGSNSWAVGPSRTEAGHALLANDPHLELSLPSIWYEVHLVVPDTLDVYGVTFPGAPGVILGMNRNIAWGATNVGADVADYYVETVNDTAAPTQYFLDGAQEALVVVEAPYLDANGVEIARDTLRYTHRGPLLRADDQWVSRRWMVLEPSVDFEPLYRAMFAQSVDEYFEVMSTYAAPAQNFIVADREGHIGIRSTGRYPIRPATAPGTRFADGSSRRADWVGFVEPVNAPQSVDPTQGYLASANQQPADPAEYPAYLGHEWPAPWRAIHINNLLRSNRQVTPDDMRSYHTDAGNGRANTFVPLLLQVGRERTATAPDDSTLARAVRLLGEWDQQFTPSNERAVLFEAVMRDLARLTWDELAADTALGTVVPSDFLAMPEEHVLHALARDPDNIWWDRRATPERESRDDILAAALASGLLAVERDHGPVEQGGWRWDGIRFANIWHPLRLPALSALRLPVQGGRESLNPSSGSGIHGASWRLVAELGTAVSGRGIYPGGQSANPVSPHYRDRIERWRVGALDSLRVPATADDLTAAHHAATLTLTPRRR